MSFVTPESERPDDPLEPPSMHLTIAAGLPRCGTTSLQYIFENTLDLEPALHMACGVPSVERMKLFLGALTENDKEKRQALLHQLFDGNAATSDLPGSAFVGDLMEMYPSAKLVLNKWARPEDWVLNLKKLELLRSKWYFAVCYWDPKLKLVRQVMKAREARMMRVLGLKSSSPSLELYEAHLNWVRGRAKARGVALLEWMPEMGYAPLRELLGKEIPQEPFPRVNDARNVKMIQVYLLTKGLLAWTDVLALLFAPVVATSLFGM